jgi:hypothetical protein
MRNRDSARLGQRLSQGGGGCRRRMMRGQSYYQKGKYSVLHAKSDDLRAFRTLVVDIFLRHMELLTAVLGIPVPERM